MAVNTSQFNSISKPTPNHLSILGADVSSLQRALDLGARYYDMDGSQTHPLDILKRHGINAIRLRAWVNPAHGYNNLAKILEFAPEVKSRDMQILVDLHYSDTWADPAHQEKPAAWAQHDLFQLQEDVYKYTFEVCSRLNSAGAAPNMVQIGNEINTGMLLPSGNAQNWENLAALLKQGYNAVKASIPSAGVMLHIAIAGEGPKPRTWFDSALEYGVQWDLTGLSYYSYWHGSMRDMTDTIKELCTRFGKPVVIVETAYPFTLANQDHEENVMHSEDQLTSGYPATPEGQQNNLRDVFNSARAGGAIGVFYWEPTWTAIPGNGWNPTRQESGNQWENQALFDFNGVALPAIDEFKP